MTSEYTIRKRFAGRLSHKSDAPRSPCERCYADGTPQDLIDGFVWFECPNGHPAWRRPRSVALAHAEYCNRSTWQEANR